MTGWFSPFLFYLSRSTENELRRQIDFFKAENEMLRREVPKQQIFLKQEDKDRLLKLGAAIGPGVHKLITIVHPRTYQRWVREKNLGKKPKKMGRPRTLESIREIVIRLAKETGWGYIRILGELRKLRIRCIFQSTIKNILKEEGIKPSPKRGPGTWGEFLKVHVETLWQVDNCTFIDDLDADWPAAGVCLGVYSSWHSPSDLFALQLQTRCQVDG